MRTRVTHIGMLLIICASFIAAILLYPSLPDQVPAHWNSAGDVTSTIAKFWGVFLLPLLMLSIYFLWIVLPLLDPLRKNIREFEKVYNTFFFLLVAFFAYLLAIMLAWDMSFRINMSVALSPALAALWWAVGMMLPRTRRNWFIGVRTPWTLSSDEVWRRTNTLGGALFKVASIVTLLGILLPEWFLGLVLIPLILFVLALTAYSYYEHRELGQ